MGYLRGTSNNLERIAQFDPIQMMRMYDPIAISVETPRIGNKCSLEKEFTEFIYMNP